MVKSSLSVIIFSMSAESLLSYIKEKRAALLFTLAAIGAYLLYIYGISSNPPGFYIDESLAAYNGYVLYSTGAGEFGHSWPLYFPVLRLPPPHDFLGFVDPVQIYLLAGLFTIFEPSFVIPRLLSATAMFLACLLIGRLAVRISGSRWVGMIVCIMALATPWLYETGRLAFGASLYPLAAALFLTAVYSAYEKERWPMLNVAAIGLTLALLTYTYSIGRLLGPLLALGLIIFATGINRFKDVLKSWVAYGVTLIPLAVFHFRNPGALTGRFSMTVGVITPDKTFGKILGTFLSNVLANLNPWTMMTSGDPNMRHHIMNAGAILTATLILSIAGILFVLLFQRKDPWWRFVLFCLLASIVPASLTRDQFHMLRLIGFPVFLLVLMIPALSWLLSAKDSEHLKRVSMHIRHAVLAGTLVLFVYNLVSFQMLFWSEGPKRGIWFDSGYQRILKTALDRPERPIYLVDGYWGQAYAHAFWYAIVNDIDASSFVHIQQGARPPAGALVISSEDRCKGCELIKKDENFLLYREVALRPPQR